jgi:hypothetical protein
MDANATDGDWIISLNGHNAKKTRVIRNSMHPRWNEAFHGVLLNHLSTTVKMLMKDEDIASDNHMSHIEILLGFFQLGKVVDEWVDMTPARRVKNDGRSHLVINTGRRGDAPFVSSAPPAPVPGAPYRPRSATPPACFSAPFLGPVIRQPRVWPTPCRAMCQPHRPRRRARSQPSEHRAIRHGLPVRRNRAMHRHHPDRRGSHRRTAHRHPNLRLSTILDIPATRQCNPLKCSTQ